MPVSVVVGGQFGSEGKGKVAHWLSRNQGASAAVRVGGPNSGHTVVSDGRRLVLRQVPTPALVPGILAVIAPGSYVDPAVLISEIRQLRLSPLNLIVDPAAIVVSEATRRLEVGAGLGARIGSTESGTGAAVLSRVSREGSAIFVRDIEVLRPFIKPVVPILREILDRDERVVLEGTQGLGLSILHAPDYPFVTSRETSAAGVLSEVGLSPVDVDEVVLVLRAFPIRVAGNSGPLANETDWQTIAANGGHDHPILEYTSVTHKLRRVGLFDPAPVRGSIRVNNPTMIVMNHLDYVDHRSCTSPIVTSKIEAFLDEVEDKLQRRIDVLGLGATELVRWPYVLESEAHGQRALRS